MTDETAERVRRTLRELWEAGLSSPWPVPMNWCGYEECWPLLFPEPDLNELFRPAPFQPSVGLEKCLAQKSQSNRPGK